MDLNTKVTKLFFITNWFFFNFQVHILISHIILIAFNFIILLESQILKIFLTEQLFSRKNNQTEFTKFMRFQTTFTSTATINSIKAHRRSSGTVKHSSPRASWYPFASFVRLRHLKTMQNHEFKQLNKLIITSLLFSVNLS